MFSPFYIFLIIFIYCVFYILLNFFSTLNEFNYLNIIIVIIIVAYLFFILVFVEIIELNCFGLSYMTKKNIELRASLDTHISDDNDDKKSNKEIPYDGYTIELKNSKICQIELNNIDTNTLNED